MSWFISLFLAGAMFASNGVNNLQPVYFNAENAGAKTAVQAEETERFEQTYPLNQTGRVAVSNINGSITVDVWDSAQVKLEYVKTSDDREALADLVVKIDARADYFSVETDQSKLVRNVTSGKAGGRKNYFRSDVAYHLTVPRGAILDEIATVNGTVNIKDTSGATKASAVNGTVNATNLRGASANLSTVNGTVNADFDRLPTSGKISLNTVNGAVNVTIPSDSEAVLRANSMNGNITNDFNLPVRKGQYVGRDLYGRIGASGAATVQIRLNSVNGELAVKRRGDGKNLSPATNLLTEKNDKDDANWDGDADTPRPPRAPRPPRPPALPDGELFDSEAIRKSLEEAQKEIARLQPDMRNITAEALKQAAAVNLNSPEIQEQLKIAQEKYREAFALMANADYGAPRVEEKSESFAVEAGTPRVTIEAGNCAVIVRGWDKREVRYAATRVSKTQTPLDLRATRDGSKINIKVLSGGDAKNSSAKSANAYYNALFNDSAARVRIEIFVPRKTDLKIVTGGEIRLEGVSGEIDLQGEDESVNVRDAGGKLNVGTSDGAIRVIGFRGSLTGRTADGVMNLEGDFSALDASAVDGTIVLTLPENADAVLESNAEIENDGVNLIRDKTKENSWRVGRGGALYNLNVGDGKVLVRGANVLK